jgi:DNA-directed RNA polymerase specialized sigma24 family protein
MRTMQDADFENWKISGRRFYSRYKKLFNRIITDNCFTGHLNLSKRRKRLVKIASQMETPRICLRLQEFQSRSTFLVFYIGILKDVVTENSQTEDIKLIHTDFNTLVLKYHPLANLILSKQLKNNPTLKNRHQDILQEISLVLLSKKNTILLSYDNIHLFRNFIWTIITNECKNQLMHEQRLFDRNSSIENVIIGEESNNSSEIELMIDNALNIIHKKILAYLHQKAKLIICLKTEYNFHIVREDIDALLSPSNNIESIIQNSLNPPVETSIDACENGKILQRFSRVKILLNHADHSTTDEHSYWRWTNLQINRMIVYLNEYYTMGFDRESFGLLIDRYFCDFNKNLIPKRELPVVYNTDQKKICSQIEKEIKRSVF